MKHVLLALILTATPAAAQDNDSLMEQGLRLFMDGLMEEMEPALRDLEDLAQDAKPLLEELQKNLGDVVQDLDAYHPPEIQPNGDILIRRKEPLVPEPELPGDIEANPDGSYDL